MSAPTIDYLARAGLNPEPLDHVHLMETAHRDFEHFLEFFSATSRLIWADISEFQQVVDSTYPYPVLAIRLDTGYRLDNHAVSNHRAVSNIAHIDALIGYAVFIPGQSKAILNRIKNAFGSQPDFAIMTDMESGPGFAGPGNHSSEANEFVAQCEAWTHDAARELGYANDPDWKSNWSSPLPWMHKVIAHYGSDFVPGYFAQQYYGGLNYPTPTGLPRACKPFGSWVDLNTAAMTLTTLQDSLGLDWLSMATKADVQAAVTEAVQAALGNASNVVNVNGLITYDHTRYASAEAFFTGIPGYRTVASRNPKKVTLEDGTELLVPEETTD